MSVSTQKKYYFECMNFIPRKLQAKLQETIKNGKSILLLGPRQTGKTTLLNQIKTDLSLNLMRPDTRQRYEKAPELLEAEILALPTINEKIPLVFIDEVQKVPILMDLIQDLIDRDVAQFLLCGSSARKLRRQKNLNLLPGRLLVLKMDAFVLKEFPNQPSLESQLLFGSLPGIIDEGEPQIEDFLQAYVTTYLEEEIRQEALVRDVSHFARFLEIAGIEAGKIINYSKIGQDIGVAHTTIATYYEILEDCLIAEKIEPITKSHSRKNLIKKPKFLFFDLGVRRVCAREGLKPPLSHMGFLFEQYIGLELLKLSRLNAANSKLKYWRTSSGQEVDWILDMGEEWVPIEVKWTDVPTNREAKHLHTFINEYEKANKGYIVCRTPNPIKISDKVTAIPWNTLTKWIF